MSTLLFSLFFFVLALRMTSYKGLRQKVISRKDEDFNSVFHIGVHGGYGYISDGAIDVAGDLGDLKSEIYLNNFPTNVAKHHARIF